MQEKVIYIVDDEKDIREMEKTFLENEGFIVETFANADVMMAGLEALNEEKQKPDLIVMDIMMEGTDGLTACSRFRKSEDSLLKVVPIILVSAKDTPLDRVTGLTMGSDDYLVKPFLPLELVARVKALLRRSELVELQVKKDMGENEKTVMEDETAETGEKIHQKTGENAEGGNNPLIFGKNAENCGNLVLDYAAHRAYVDQTLSEPQKTGDLWDENVDKRSLSNHVNDELTEENILERRSGTYSDTEYEKISSKRGHIIEVQLTPMEFEFVHYLMLRKETAVSKSELLSEIWHLPDAGLQEDVRMTDDLVKRLRKKLKGAASTARVETVWGYGYRLTEY